jgi:hypothetical protein
MQSIIAKYFIAEYEPNNARKAQINNDAIINTHKQVSQNKLE